MLESLPFELPSPNEKLPFKFILDSIKEDIARAELLLDGPHVESRVELVAQNEEGTEICESSIEPTHHALPTDKKYFRIGEVSELLSVEPYVLRYWEGVFKTVRPVKSGSGHRVYSRKDVEQLVQIKHLLHDEKFSIKGAKQRLAELKKGPKEVASAPSERHKESLKHFISEIKGLIQLARNPL